MEQRLIINLKNNVLFCTYDTNNLFFISNGKLKNVDYLGDKDVFYRILLSNQKTTGTYYFDPIKFPPYTYDLYRFTKIENKYYLQREFIYVTYLVVSKKLDITDSVNNIYNELELRYASFFNDFNINNERFKLDISIPNYNIVYNITDTLLDVNNIKNLVDRLNLKINDINNIDNLFININKATYYKNGLLIKILFKFEILYYMSTKTLSYILSFDLPPFFYYIPDYRFYQIFFFIDVNPILALDDNNTVKTIFSNKIKRHAIHLDIIYKYTDGEYKILKDNDKYYFVRRVKDDSDNFLHVNQTEYYNRKSDISDIINEYMNIINNIPPVLNTTTKLKISGNKIIYSITKV
jgi:hypothetical protein